MEREKRTFLNRLGLVGLALGLHGIVVLFFCHFLSLQLGESQESAASAKQGI